MSNIALEHAFECPLPNGLHARPATQLADVASRFASDITLTNERTASSANAKSVLAMVAIDVKRGDGCRVRISGADASPAHAALREFLTNVLPGCDEPLPTAAHSAKISLPPSLLKAASAWHAGTPACPGVGHGAVVIVGGLALPADLERLPSAPPDEESEKVRRALAAVRIDLERRLAAGASEIETGILQANLSIAGDVALHAKIHELIVSGRSAGSSVVEAGRHFAAQLKAAESRYVQERAADVEDICLQMLEQVYGARYKPAAITLTEPSIVAGENITPRQLLTLDKRFVRGIVLQHAAATSHAVILARSFNIPTLVGVSDVRTKLPAGREVIVDANLGIVIPEATPAVLRYYALERRKQQRRRERFAAFMHSPAATRDGRRMEVAANVATAEELGPAFAQGADGIGLFRTEMLYLDRESAPTEEEQFALFVQAARSAAGRPVIIRTFDVGGDKRVPYMKLPKETNPFLGFRGVRIYQEHRALFIAQLRAIVRASAFGRVWLMVPMVCAVDEVRWVREQVAQVQASLKSAGIAFDPALRIGIMVEVPSTAFIIDQMATEVDFFSIGTNDLTQYFLAVDRDGHRVAGLYSARHPSVLRLLDKIVRDAHRCGKWVGMCGEMTRSPRNVPLLVGLGLDEISMASPEIASQKAAISQLSATDCRELLERAMDCRGVAEVEDTIANFRSRAEGSSLLDRELIVMESDSGTKEEAIKEAVDAFFAAGRTDHAEAVEEAIWAREKQYSTGLGFGFAIPHCKTDAVAANSIGVVRLKRPVEWGSVDGKPVDCVILLASRETDKDNVHMKVFSRLARKLMHEEFREKLLRETDADAVLRCLSEELGIDGV